MMFPCVDVHDYKKCVSKIVQGMESYIFERQYCCNLSDGIALNV